MPDTTYQVFSPLHIEYLKKIETLAKEKGIEVIALPPPMIMPRKKKINQFMRQEIADHNLDYLFRHYFKHLEFKPKNQFRDLIHLKPKFTNEYKLKYRKLVLDYQSKITANL